MMLLGTWLYDPFYLYVKKPVSGLEDLKGVKMRTATKYDKMMLKLGMVPVTVQFVETYTALQRGVVEGFGWPTIGPREWGRLEYVKNVIDIPFYARQNTFIVVNLDMWNKLPKKVQDSLLDNTVRTVEGKVSGRRVWIRITSREANVSQVLVQTRNSAGGSDIGLAHELEKQIALKLVR